MLEKTLEKKFVEAISAMGGRAVKGPAYQYKGIPDRIAVLPNGGGTVWVEFKNGVYTLQPLQLYWKNLLTGSDPDRYMIVDSEESLTNCINKCKSFCKKGN